MNGRTCRHCRDGIEDPNSLLDLCYGCRLDLLIPDDYPAREDYGYVMPGDPIKARRRPATGVGVLDAPPPVRSDDIAARVRPAALAARCRHEQDEGESQDIGFYENIFYGKVGK